MATPVSDPYLRYLIQNRLPLPNSVNTFVDLLTPSEYDCYCCEKGTIAGISPSNYILYTKNYFNTNVINAALTRSFIPN